MIGPDVTVVVPNFRTERLTRLCLRLLRRHLDPARARVVAVDNGSGDESVDYLRSLSWIELIERDSSQDPSPSAAHARALDLALERTTTPYLLSIHTDTFVKRGGLIELLLARVADSRVAGVGSWKLERKSLFARTIKRVERAVQGSIYRAVGRSTDRLRTGHYLRSHCALYRTEPLRELGLSFVDPGETSTGRRLHEALVAAGYDMVFLESEELGPYVDHVNHATMVLHPELGARQRSVIQGRKAMERAFREFDAERVLADDALDR